MTQKNHFISSWFICKTSAFCFCSEGCIKSPSIILNKRTRMCLIIRMLRGPGETSGFPGLLPGDSDSVGLGCSRNLCLTTIPEFSQSGRSGEHCPGLYIPKWNCLIAGWAHVQLYSILLPCSLRDSPIESPHQHCIIDIFFSISLTFAIFRL